jgi:hypothetical protein
VRLGPLTPDPLTPDPRYHNIACEFIDYSPVHHDALRAMLRRIDPHDRLPARHCCPMGPRRWRSRVHLLLGAATMRAGPVRVTGPVIFGAHLAVLGVLTGLTL